MPSLRARFFLSLLRNRHLLRGKLRPDTAMDWATDLASVRGHAAQSSKLMGRVPKGFSVRPVSGFGQGGEWITPPGARKPKEGMVLYFRGGGYVLGSVATHRAIVSKFLKGGRVPALCFEYRLAPEHPHPAALEDALAAWRWVRQQNIPPEKIIFAGDSAGGGLLLATLIALRDAGEPMPAGAVALSPWTDVACTGETLTSNAATCLSPTNSWLACRTHYCADADPTAPYISPLYADLTGLPPLLIFAGDQETLLSDSTRFTAKAQQAGVDVSLTVGQGMCHCYPALAPILPEATQAMQDIRTFIRQRLQA